MHWYFFQKQVNICLKLCTKYNHLSFYVMRLISKVTITAKKLYFYNCTLKSRFILIHQHIIVVCTFLTLKKILTYMSLGVYALKMPSMFASESLGKLIETI